MQEQEQACRELTVQEQEQVQEQELAQGHEAEARMLCHKGQCQTA